MARILVAEDDDAVRAFLEKALELDNHELVTAVDGAEAVDRLQESNGAFDLLLTDIQMPVMDGIALALQTARDYPDLTIILMTGYAHQRERAYGLDSLVYDVIMKPFALSDIREMVQRALDERASQ